MTFQESETLELKEIVVEDRQTGKFERMASG